MLQVDKDNLIQQNIDIQILMNTEYGRRFCWRLLSYCGVYRDLEGTYEEMLKQAGRRQTGLYLLGILSEANEDQVFIMMKEAKSKTEGDNNVREQQQRTIDSDEYDDTNSHDYDSRDAFGGYI